MSWFVLYLFAAGCGLALLALLSHRRALTRTRVALAERARALRAGDEEARLQHPVVDLGKCLGCATCVAVCPENGVIEIVHGQAVVVNGARCQGIAACERECPAGAITVRIANLATRDDVPAIDEHLEAVGVPGVFLPGEVTAHALIRVAVEHGTRVADEVARRPRAKVDGEVDLCIVGAGPAGLACALRARELGLSFVLCEQEDEIGGTVARYPRRKLVLTEPVDLPLVGRLRRRTWEKEELIELWQRAVHEHRIEVATSAVLQEIRRERDDVFVVRTTHGEHRARHVCLALGRRGAPRRLGVPGEQLTKVVYSLIDAGSYQGRRILVVGGGDSAVEAALALSAQPGNEVTLSYRKEEFVRVRSRNLDQVRVAVDAGRIRLRLRSEVRSISTDSVVLACADDGEVVIGNDDVFVMIGGVPPFELLARCGVSFDPASRPEPREEGSPRSGALPAIVAGLCVAVVALAFAFLHRGYYALPLAQRPTHPDHAWLRPGRGLGLALGIGSAVLVLLNLAYLLRRARRPLFRFGTLSAWMSVHVATGLAAALCALLHAALAPRDTPGGNALWAMLVIVLTGVVGRWIYAQVPRATNGRELALADVRSRLLAIAPHDGGFADHAREVVESLVERRQWRGSFSGRLLAFAGVKLDLSRALRRLTAEARAHGIDAGEASRTLALAREAHRLALATGHLEDLRGVLATWRWMHRWLAVLMVVLIGVHVVYALLYGSLLGERAMP
ncbi:MAG: NAD(P)-binding domain-containing protein [Planctomycetota bacterium]